MRKSFLPLFLLFLLSLSQTCKADEISIIDSLKKIPGLKQGVAFDVAEGKLNYLTTIGIIKYNDFGLDAGYSSDDKIVATLSYDIGGLRKLGIQTPITDLVDLRVGMYVGFGRVTGSNEFSWGPSVTVINVHF